MADGIVKGNAVAENTPLSAEEVAKLVAWKKQDIEDEMRKLELYRQRCTHRSIDGKTTLVRVERFANVLKCTACERLVIE